MNILAGTTGGKRPKSGFWPTRIELIDRKNIGEARRGTRVKNWLIDWQKNNVTDIKTRSTDRPISHESTAADVLFRAGLATPHYARSAKTDGVTSSAI